MGEAVDESVAERLPKPGTSAKANAEWVKQQRPLDKMCRSGALVGIS